jgi:hypothetical protein
MLRCHCRYVLPRHPSPDATTRGKHVRRRGLFRGPIAIMARSTIQVVTVLLQTDPPFFFVVKCSTGDRLDSRRFFGILDEGKGALT